MLRLTESQQGVVNHDQGPLLVVAGPGSGKTRVLTERIRRLLKEDDSHYRVLALTFTNKAANEMVERLDDVPNIASRAFIGTIHSFCTEVLSNRGKSVGIEGLPNIFESYDDRLQIMGEAAQEDPQLRYELQSLHSQKERTARLRSWLKEISELKNALLLPEMVADEGLARVYSLYDQQLRASDAIDFDDLLLLTYRLFEERPKIADFYRRQYKYICVDEAQDLNEAQYRVLCALCGTHFNNIMMVGDPKQAIFTWNGANPKFLDMFARDYSAKVVSLDENFRSARSVVEAAKRLDSTYAVDGVLPISGEIEVWECDDEKSEAEAVADKLQELLEIGHSDIEGDVTHERCAIIGRNRYVFREIESVLKERDIPYYKKVTSGGVRSESDAMGELELALRVLANPNDRLHLGLLLKRWKVGASVDDFLTGEHRISGKELVRQVAASTSEATTAVLESVDALEIDSQRLRLSAALDTLEHSSTEMDEETRALLLQDLEDWRKHWDFYVRSEPSGSQSIQAFLSQVALGTTQQPREDGLALLTVHSSKGMEFDVVFLISMTEGTFPDYRATGAQLEEEQRNAFVAVTRTRRLLFATYPNEKLMPWGDTKRQQPSRYLDALLVDG